MNLRWIQKYLIAIIATVVFVVVLAGTIWLWQRAASEKSEVVTQLEEQNAKLTQLRGQPLAPSSDNIEILKHAIEQVSQIYAKLQEGTTRPPLTITNLVRDIQFKQLLGETADRLAKQAVRNLVKTPDNFLYGFSRYDAEFPCKQSGASAEECKKTLALLGKQLLALEKLAGLLMESHIDEITHIRRTEVDPGTSNPDALEVPITTDAKGLYVAYPFEFEFIGDTKALRNFLNSMANADQLFAVRTVKIDSLTAQITTGGAAGAPPGQAVAAAEPSRTIERRRLTVVVRVDLVEFTPPPAAPAVPAPKAPSPER